MYVDINELMKYVQYTEFESAYCFDTMTYTIEPIERIKDNDILGEQRYIHLLRIDQYVMQHQFIKKQNDANLLQIYMSYDRCFEQFAHVYGLWNDWYQYYKRRLYELEVFWCKKNCIVYKK